MDEEDDTWKPRTIVSFPRISSTSGANPPPPLPRVIYSNSIDTFFQCLIGKWLTLSVARFRITSPRRRDGGGTRLPCGGGPRGAGKEFPMDIFDTRRQNIDFIGPPCRCYAFKRRNRGGDKRGRNVSAPRKRFTKELTIYSAGPDKSRGKRVTLTSFAAFT